MATKYKLAKRRTFEGKVYTLESIQPYARAEATAKLLRGNGWNVRLFPIAEESFNKVAIYRRKR